MATGQEATERQRKIGQQIMLIRLLMNENKKAGMPSFIRSSDIAVWMDEKKEHVDEFISDYTAMTPYVSAQNAAMEYCRDKDECDVGYVFRTMYHFGIQKVRSSLKREAFDYEGSYRRNWTDFTAIRDYQGTDSSVTDLAGFKAMLDCYQEHYMNHVRELEKKNYDPDVIAFMIFGSV